MADEAPGAPAPPVRRDRAGARRQRFVIAGLVLLAVVTVPALVSLPFAYSVVQHNRMLTGLEPDVNALGLPAETTVADWGVNYDRAVGGFTLKAAAICGCVSPCYLSCRTVSSRPSTNGSCP